MWATDLTKDLGKGERLLDLTGSNIGVNISSKNVKVNISLTMQKFLGPSLPAAPCLWLPLCPDPFSAEEPLAHLYSVPSPETSKVSLQWPRDNSQTPPPRYTEPCPSLCDDLRLPDQAPRGWGGETLTFHNQKGPYRGVFQSESTASFYSPIPNKEQLPSALYLNSNIFVFAE